LFDLVNIGTLKVLDDNGLLLSANKKNQETKQKQFCETRNPTPLAVVVYLGYAE